MNNFSICQGCGCKTSRLILCDDCANPTAKLARELKKFDKKQTTMTTVPPTASSAKSGTISFIASKSNLFKVEAVEGTLRINRKAVKLGQTFESNINLAGTFSHDSFKSLVKGGLVK